MAHMIEIDPKKVPSSRVFSVIQAAVLVLCDPADYFKARSRVNADPDQRDIPGIGDYE